MTPRSKLYFKIKNAIRFIAHESGRRYLAERGVFPIPFAGQGRSGFLFTANCGYFIDKKGNIVGTAVRTTTPKPVNLPITSSYEVKFSFKP